MLIFLGLYFYLFSVTFNYTNIKMYLELLSSHSKDEDTLCEWPVEGGLTVEINNKPVQFKMKRRVPVPGRPNAYTVVDSDEPINMSPFCIRGANSVKFVATKCCCVCHVN